MTCSLQAQCSGIIVFTCEPNTCYIHECQIANLTDYTTCPEVRRLTFQAKDFLL